MSVYLVHVPETGDQLAAAQKTIFVRDGFSLAAFLLTPFWLLWHRLWLEFVLYLLAIVAIGFGGRLLGLSPGTGSMLSLLVSLYVGLEGSTLRSANLARRRFALTDIVTGSQIDDIEHRFFRRFFRAPIGRAAA